MTALLTQSTETNRALGRHFFEEQDRLRGGPAPALCATNYRATLNGNPEFDLAGHTGFAAGFYAGFPDAHHTIDDVVATDDAVVVRFFIKGTHTGNFFGIPASGKSMAVTCTAILHVRDGLVTTLKAVFDEAGMLRQLGVMP